MCPYHHFRPEPGCYMCCALSAGFVSGFQGSPTKWNLGFDRMKSQGGIVLANSGTPEEEQNRFIGQQIRASYSLLTQRNLNTAGQAWQNIPSPAREQLTLAGLEGLGSLGGSIAASQVCLISTGFFAGQIVRSSSTLRPMLAVRTPAYFAASMLLAALSHQGAMATLVTRQRRIFTQYPGTEPLFKSTLDKYTKDSKK